MTSKQLNLLAYIGRTSYNQEIKRIEQDLERIKRLKFLENTFNVGVDSAILALAYA